MAEEKWYTPVDIGEHLDTDSAKEEELGRDQVKETFQKKGILREKALQRYEKLRDKWLEENGADYIKRFENDKSFHLDRGGHPVSAEISSFSKSKAVVHIKFPYGYSRWHHYYIALVNLTVERSPYIDEVFNLNRLEKLYSFSFNGIAHDTHFKEAERILGNDYYEYADQSPQYRQIYFEHHNIEVIVQNQRVKYIQQGKPAWMDTEMKNKRCE